MAANLILHMHKTPKIYLKSRPPLGELGVHFGAILRVLGGVLGRLGGVLGGLRGVLGRLGGGLGGFWLPGATWEASGAALG